MKIISVIQDYSSNYTKNTLSVLSELSIKDFRNLLVENKWLDINEVELGQRKFITGTHKSKLVRERLQKDIIKGAVLPPIVMGFVCENINFIDFQDNSKWKELTKLLKENYEKIFILDGVQRCTNLGDADEETLQDTQIRVEWWITDKIDSALDRMLILNFAQTPWSIKQQGKAIALLFKKADADFAVFAKEFEKELEEEPHKFLECLYSFQKRKNDVFIKDEISSVFLQDYDDPEQSQLRPFAVTYKVACLWSKFLPASHSARIGICLALADILDINPEKELEEKKANLGNKVILWTNDYLLELAGDIAKDKTNYLAFETVKAKYEQIKSAIAISSREMFRVGFTEIFNNILTEKSGWVNPIEKEESRIYIENQFGEIWEKAHAQIGRGKE